MLARKIRHQIGSHQMNENNFLSLSADLVELFYRRLIDVTEIPHHIWICCVAKICKHFLRFWIKVQATVVVLHPLFILRRNRQFLWVFFSFKLFFLNFFLFLF